MLRKAYIKTLSSWQNSEKKDREYRMHYIFDEVALCVDGMVTRFDEAAKPYGFTSQILKHLNTELNTDLDVHKASGIKRKMGLDTDDANRESIDNWNDKHTKEVLTGFETVSTVMEGIYKSLKGRDDYEKSINEQPLESFNFQQASSMTLRRNTNKDLV